MGAAEAILQQWVARVMDEFPDQCRPLLAGEQDRFKNPVGALVRENLGVLVAHLTGETESCRAFASVAALVRVLALQQGGRAGAERFLALVRPILSERIPERESIYTERLERLTRAAGEEYLRCRELLATVRDNERRRALAVPAALAGKTGIRPCLSSNP